VEARRAHFDWLEGERFEDAQEAEAHARFLGAYVGASEEDVVEDARVREVEAQAGRATTERARRRCAPPRSRAAIGRTAAM
jgi:hypothetical protein